MSTLSNIFNSNVRREGQAPGRVLGRAQAPAQAQSPAQAQAPAEEAARTLKVRQRGGGRVLRRVVLACAGLFVGLSLYQANANLVVRDPLPMPFGIGAATVTSGSMEPTLHVNDLVFVRQADGVNVGDVVVFQNGPSLVVHRVVSLSEGEAQGEGEVATMVTRGDANSANDEPVPLSAVKGVVAFSLPVVGGLAQALRTPVGMLVVLLVVVALVERSYRAADKNYEQQLDAIRAEIESLRRQSPGECLVVEGESL